MAKSDADSATLSGISGDEVDSHQAGQSNKAESATPPTSTSPANKSQKSPASKKRVLTSAEDAERVVKKSKRRESEEEGEASSTASSPPSLRSASMSESASDDSPTGGKTRALKFPVDGKFASEAEKAEVMALPEVRREEILAERATMIERDQQNRMLIQLLRNKGRKDTMDIKETKEIPDVADKKKRKAPATEPEENQRKSTRQKTTLGGRKIGETSAPLEEYKKQREQREAQIEQKKKEDAIKGKTQKKVDESLDADAEGESEDDWDQGKRLKTTTATPTKATPTKTTPPKATITKATLTKTHTAKAPAAKSVTPPQPAPAPIVHEEESADLHDFNRAKIGRAGFGQFCFHPGFEDTITGCIVRVAMGVDKATGQNRYNLGQIKRFTEGKPYALEGPTGSRFVTTQYLIAAHGKSEKEFPFIFCSDSKATQAELDRFKRYCTEDSVPIPTKSFLVKKVGAINVFINRKLTNDELNEKLRRSGAQERRMAPLLRAQIRTRRERAVARGDEAVIAQLDAELAVINGPKLAFGTKLYDDPPEKKEPDIQDRIALINQRNRKLNAIEVRKAQLRERKAARELEERIARGEAQRDPFARVKTIAKTRHDAYAHLPKPKPDERQREIDELFEDPEDSEAVTSQTQELISSAEKVEAAPAPKVENKDLDRPKPKKGNTAKKPYSWFGQEPTFEDILAEEDSGLDSDLELP